MQNPSKTAKTSQDELEDKALNIYFIDKSMRYICYSTFAKDFEIAEN